MSKKSKSSKKHQKSTIQSASYKGSKSSKKGKKAQMKGKGRKVGAKRSCCSIFGRVIKYILLIALLILIIGVIVILALSFITEKGMRTDTKIDVMRTAYVWESNEDGSPTGKGIVKILIGITSQQKVRLRRLDASLMLPIGQEVALAKLPQDGLKIEKGVTALIEYEYNIDPSTLTQTISSTLISKLRTGRTLEGQLLFKKAEMGFLNNLIPGFKEITPVFASLTPQVVFSPPFY